MKRILEDIDMEEKIEKTKKENAKGVKNIIKAVEDPVAAIIILLATMMILYYLSSYFWTLFVIMVLTFLISGTISNYVTSSSDIPVLGEKFTAKGHAYLLFMFYVVVGTIISGLFANYIVAVLSGANFFELIIANLFIILLSYAYFHFFFYKK